MATVDDAKNIVERLTKDRFNQPRIKMSQLRKFLSAVNVLSNKMQFFNGENLDEKLISEIQYLRVKLAYQVGRNVDVREFADVSNLDNKIKQIKTKTQFVDFARFMEAIIAYHKFYGGKD